MADEEEKEKQENPEEQPATPEGEAAGEPAPEETPEQPVAEETPAEEKPAAEEKKEEPAQEEAKKSEESASSETPKGTAPETPEEGQPKKKKVKRDRSALLGAALFGALLMNAVLLGITTNRQGVKQGDVPAYADQGSKPLMPSLPPDIPNAERHLDVILGLADTYRRQGQLDKARDLYLMANRTFGSSVHAEKLRIDSLLKADKFFETGKYRRARALYYNFLCIADSLPKEEQSLIQKAAFRVAECSLREAIEAERD